jgi:hypothetical protein
MGMLETESRQVRRARKRREALSPKLAVQRVAGNRSARRAKRKNDAEIIIRASRPLNAVAALKRTRRDFRIRHNLRPARGMVHPRTISEHRYIALRIMSLIFTAAAKRAELRRAAA